MCFKEMFSYLYFIKLLNENKSTKIKVKYKNITGKRKQLVVLKKY